MSIESAITYAKKLAYEQAEQEWEISKAEAFEAYEKARKAWENFRRVRKEYNDLKNKI